MKKRVLLLSFLLGIIFYSSFSFAFSMSPGIHRFEYDEINGLDEEFSFVLRSSSRQTIALSISLLDELEEFVEMDTSEVILAPGEAKSVPVRLIIPPNLDKVGVKEAKITFTKRIQDDQGGFMVVTTALRARIIVTFAYPGEYIIITRLDPVNVNQGENTVVNWEVQARGMETTSFRNELFVKNIEGDVVFSNNFPVRYLERNQRYGESTSIPSSSFPPGNYDVLFVSSSRDNSDNETKVLRIGEEDIGLVEFSPQNFSVGEIVEFGFRVESLWNDAFSNVYGVLDVGGVSTTTRSARLNAFSSVLIDKQFIDLRTLEEGLHEGTLTIFFDGNSKSFDVSLLAVNDTGSSNVYVIVSGAALILILIGVLLVFLFKKSNKKKRL